MTTMFRGTATLLRANPRFNRVLLWGTLGLLPVIALIALLPAGTSKSIAPLLLGGLVAAYAAAVSRVIVPSKQTVTLTADARGLEVDGRVLHARAEIQDAYLRPAVAAFSGKGIHAPAWPLTAEIITSRGQLNIDVGSEGAAREVVVAIGFAPRMVAATHVARSPQNEELKRTGWMVVVALNLGIVLIAVLAAWLRS